MADRFPSIEDFSEGQTEVKGNNDLIDGDAEDDFLTRERAALGDDADQFAKAGDSGGRSATVADFDGDLIDGGDDDVLGGQESIAFESSFPAIDTSNDAIGPGGTITGPTTLPSHGGNYSSYKAPEEEPEVITEWRERRNLALSHRAETSEKKKQQTVKTAQEAIDDFYENYNNKKDKGIGQTRKEAEEFLASRQDTSAGGTSWDRISKLVDISGKGAKGGASGTGKEKFRELLVSLRKDEDAPGASGV